MFEAPTLVLFSMISRIGDGLSCQDEFGATVDPCFAQRFPGLGTKPLTPCGGASFCLRSYRYCQHGILYAWGSTAELCTASYTTEGQMSATEIAGKHPRNAWQMPRLPLHL